MSKYKHLTDLLKICSVLPALAILPAFADNMAADGQEYSGIVENFVNSDSTRGGAITINYNTPNVSVADGTLFRNNETQVSAGGVIKALNGFKIGNGVQFVDNKATDKAWGAGALYIKLADGDVASDDTNITIGDAALFQGNVAGLGGAIGLEYGNLEIGDNASFAGNKATSTEATHGGGAIIVWQDPERPDMHSTLKIDSSSFSRNEAANVGGAIAIFDKGAVTDLDGSVFVQNVADVKGGAIYNEGIMDIEGKFAENSAGVEGGAVYNDIDAKLNVENTSFARNKTEGYGGAIGSKGQIRIENSSFSNNSALVGGALYSGYNDKGTGKGAAVIVGTEFSGNEAIAGAGAIANYGDMEINISQTLFDGNMVTGEIADDGYDNHNLNTSVDGGGAIFAGSASKTNVENAVFVNNSSTVTGGAISTRADWYSSETNKTINSKEPAPEGYDTSTDYLKPNSKAELNLKGVMFANNSAGTYGGAIYNTFVNTSVENAVFTGNSANRNGGAIYNESVAKIELSGNNVFSGNTANGIANDIHNDGVLDVVSGTTKIGSGITGDGTLNIVEGATLDIGTTTVQQNSINLDGTLAAKIMNAESFAKIQVSDIFVGQNGLLDLVLGAAGTYDIGTIVPVEKIAYNDAVYNISFDDNNSIVVSTKSVDEIVSNTNLSSGAANTVSVLANAKNDLLNTISLHVQEDFADGNVSRVEAETAKLNPEDKTVAQSVSTSVQNQILSLAAGRMAGTSVGRSGGDLAKADYGVWAQGLYNHSKYNGKFSGNTSGISVGADTLIDGKYTLGIGYAYNDTDVDSTSRDTAIESNSVFVYGQYKPAEWYVNAALNYTMSDYTETSDPYGVVYESKYDVNSFGGQIAAGYDFAFGLTPELSVRYLNVSQDAYDALLGHVDAADANYLTGSAGVKYAFEIKSDSELKLRPELRAAATYDFLSDAAIATITAPGNLSYVLDAERLSRLGGEFGLGLSAQYRGLEVSLNYDLDVHEDYTSQTGMLKFRYDF